jgi:hypothetical protein
MSARDFGRAATMGRVQLCAPTNARDRGHAKRRPARQAWRFIGVCFATTLALTAVACSSNERASPPSSPREAAQAACDSTVTSAAELESAAADPANRGKVVCAVEGHYGAVTFEDVRHPDGAEVTLRSRSRNGAVLPGVHLRTVTGLRIENFRIKGGVENEDQPINRVDFVGNDIGGTTTGAFILRCRVANVLIERNHIHDIAATEEWWTGYGISSAGEPSCGVRTNLRIRYNTIERVQKDGMELGDVRSGEIIGNVLRGINTGSGDPTSHTDSLMIWANSGNLLVKDNRITDGNGVIISGTHNIRFENNLVANIDNWCWDNGTSGSTQAAPIDTTWVNNTVYDCGSDYDGGGFGGTYAFLVDGDAPSGNVVSKNLLSNLAGSTSHFAASSNLIQNDPLPSSTDRRFTPVFADRVDWQPTNLPTGYEDVGYKPAPAGHLAPP